MTRPEIYEELGKLKGEWKDAIRAEYKKSWTNCSNIKLEQFILDWKTRTIGGSFREDGPKAHNGTLFDNQQASIGELKKKLDSNAFLNETCGKPIYDLSKDEEAERTEADDLLKALKRWIEKIIKNCR